jgi:hypothetical protein
MMNADARAGYFLHPRPRGAAIVMMKAVEDSQRDDVAGEFWVPVNWLLLVDARCERPVL